MKSSNIENEIGIEFSKVSDDNKKIILMILFYIDECEDIKKNFKLDKYILLKYLKIQILSLAKKKNELNYKEIKAYLNKLVYTNGKFKLIYISLTLLCIFFALNAFSYIFAGINIFNVKNYINKDHITTEFSRKGVDKDNYTEITYNSFSDIKEILKLHF